MGNGSCSQFTAHCLCLSPAPVWDPSMDFSNVSPTYGMQFFSDVSSLIPFLAVQSFRNALLQNIFPAGLQVLPINLLQHRLSTGSQSPSGTPSCSDVGYRWFSACPWTSMGCRVTDASPCSSPWTGF